MERKSGSPPLPTTHPPAGSDPERTGGGGGRESLQNNTCEAYANSLTPETQASASLLCSHPYLEHTTANLLSKARLPSFLGWPLFLLSRFLSPQPPTWPKSPGVPAAWLWGAPAELGRPNLLGIPLPWSPDTLWGFSAVDSLVAIRFHFPSRGRSRRSTRASWFQQTRPRRGAGASWAGLGSVHCAGGLLRGCGGGSGGGDTCIVSAEELTSTAPDRHVRPGCRAHPYTLIAEGASPARLSAKFGLAALSLPRQHPMPPVPFGACLPFFLPP